MIAENHQIGYTITGFFLKKKNIFSCNNIIGRNFTKITVFMYLILMYNSF